MTKLAWMTDIHLNFLNKIRRFEFYDEIKAMDCDAVMITGDISEAPDFIQILHEMKEHIQMPIYFVLGNHDYYEGSIEQIRDEMHTFTSDLLGWLNKRIINLAEGIILVGVDGWADCRYGNYTQSMIRLNDSVYIRELASAIYAGKDQLREKMQYYADADAQSLRDNMRVAIGEHKIHKVIVATHVPPFRENAKYRGQPSNDDFLPFYASKATGDVLLEFADNHPEIEFEVYCGHSHGAAIYQPRPNLIVETGAANYNSPVVQKIIHCK